MGCDIHFYVEAKKNDKWESADTWVVDTDYDEPRKTVPYKQAFYSGRNYNLFAILADVRNGRGFAGCDTGDRFNPISEPKGLPEDVSPEVKQESDRWDGDGHSHSFHTLAALLAYDWTQVTKHRGFCTALEYWDWNRYRRGDGRGPESYCGDVSGAMVKKITSPQMDEFLKPITEKGGRYDEIRAAIEARGARLYAAIEWEEPYYRSCSNFLGEVIPRLLRLGAPEDVRIVFWFDN